MENQKYLKCNYSPGLFSDEFAVEFEGCHDSLGEIWVNKSDVIPLDENSGLVKACYFELGKKTANVWINDVGNHRLSSFNVPRENVVDYNFSLS
ncbi:hypothetical protein HOD29_04700 [archaeon]|jgi:hypothetical protein|nr:hypothetical protein [archaeon]